MIFTLPRAFAFSPLRLISRKWISKLTPFGQSVKQAPLLPTTVSLSDIVLYAPHLETTYQAVQHQPRSARRVITPSTAFRALQLQAAQDQVDLRQRAAQRLERARDILIARRPSLVVLPLEQCDIPQTIVPMPAKTTRCWRKQQFTYKRSCLSSSSDDVVDLASLRSPLPEYHLEQIADRGAEEPRSQARLRLRVRLVEAALERANEVFEEAQEIAQPWYDLD